MIVYSANWLHDHVVPRSLPIHHRGRGWHINLLCDWLSPVNLTLDLVLLFMLNKMIDCDLLSASGGVNA